MSVHNMSLWVFSSSVWLVDLQREDSVILAEADVTNDLSAVAPSTSTSSSSLCSNEELLTKTIVMRGRHQKGGRGDLLASQHELTHRLHFPVILRVVDISVDKYESARREMSDRTGRATVPQIFFNARHVGGNEELQKLVHSLVLSVPTQLHSDTQEPASV